MSENDRATVFVVDDEEMVTAALCSLLELDTPYHVRAFQSAEAALAELEAEAPSVLVADFMMPGMDGVTFLREARARRPQATRVLLTGYADKENAIRAINEAGLYYYLEKPWDNQRLKLVIRNGVERCALFSELDERVAALEGTNRELTELRRRLVSAFM